MKAMLLMAVLGASMLQKEDFLLISHSPYNEAYNLVEQTGKRVIIYSGVDKVELDFYKNLAQQEGKGFVVVESPTSIKGAIELMKLDGKVQFIERKDFK